VSHRASAETPRQRPSRADLALARGKTVPDLVRPGLRVLFCGINPSLFSAAVGHHFARPGNRFWKTLHGAGFTDRVLRPDEERELLDRGCGITNVVSRATASARDLSLEDYVAGAVVLARKVRRYRPRFVAFVGIEAYRVVARAPHARAGPRPEPFAGARVWVLPNPSGLNAHYQIAELVTTYAPLARAASR
jgi:TDG/mug DNA glycosylase family protein